jgi:hypothetical protein
MWGIMSSPEKYEKKAKYPSKESKWIFIWGEKKASKL